MRYAPSQMTGTSRLFGAVEAGGTKFVCAIGNDRGEILAQERFPTGDPPPTLAEMHGFLQRGRSLGALAAIGIASFGPVELDRSLGRFMVSLANTPKAGWSGIDIAGGLGG